VNHYVVDASNVIGSRPDGWWRDRRAAEDRLVTAVARRAAAGTDAYTVVLDRQGRDREHDRVSVRHARRAGRDAADDVIVDVVASAGDAAELVVVTADRDLRRRVEALGARVAGPREFRDRLDG
jgi:predicted RNA-binding protein with PIN domain